ncbi:M20/M25/M40 family metallo-hydrolase [Daejeonella oryzae]|uniref:M20/M25/M40 family metallo-hydrolase n=1 Tax=Daejeonella oryzae TaxID=1122943 RepID=UPI0004114504|nr:M20/M25/M40 family metallo-hydrolase [Daejeonella oryzae]
MKKLLVLLLLSSSFYACAQKINRNQLLKDVETLSSDIYEGRKTGSSGNIQAANYIVSRFKNIGLSFYQDSFKHPFTVKTQKGPVIKGTNLIGYIKGRTDHVIIISAHYDHIGITDSLINNGADDNASGVAGLLAMAEYFKKHKPKNTLLFIAFDAEEMGLQGAYAYIKNPVLDGKRIKMIINLDMISHNDKGELYAAGSYKNPEIKSVIKGADKDTGVKILFGHDDPKLGRNDWTMQSDQGPFAQDNIPFIYFGVEDHKDYHKPSDEYQNINADFFYGASNAILNSTIKVDKRLKRIKFNTDSAFQKTLKDKMIMEKDQ